MFTTDEAARRLGVTPRRVRALAQSGQLVAEKHGSLWLFDEESVLQRSSNPVAIGRPRSASRHMESFTLMNGFHEVCTYTINTVSGAVTSVKPADAAYAPPGACPRPGKLNKHYLTGWLHERRPSEARPDLKGLLEGKSPLEYQQYNLALSLSDQYWTMPEGADLTWKDVNLFENRYKDTADPFNEERTRYSPSTGGALPKWWEQDDSMKSVLVKTGRRDSVAERAATLMYKRLLEDGQFVEYDLVMRGDELCSSCPCFVDSHLEFVAMEHVVRCYSGGIAGYEEYVAACEKLGVAGVRSALARMIVCDYIIGNRDRHTFNLGVIRDSTTLEYTGVAPIFDNGQGFFRSATKEEDFNTPFLYESNPFDPVPQRQLALVEDWDWFDADALEGFAQQAAELHVGYGVLSETAAEGMERLLNQRIARVAEYALEAQHTIRR